MTYEKRIIIGADHAGFLLKQDLVERLRKKGYDVEDVGAYSEESVDYPDYAVKVARAVAGAEFSKGILICGSGHGVTITANKIAGIRAVNANDPESARLSRLHNDANVLAIGARLVDGETAADIANVWLETEFEGGRHQARLDKITRIEEEERS